VGVIKIGLIVNPIAGMGGSVGLKGTDGDAGAQARLLGATPVTPERTEAFVAHLRPRADTMWLVAPGLMGEAYAAPLAGQMIVVGERTPQESAAQPASTTASDTRRLARLMVESGADLIVFVGGDGTARDLLDAVGVGVPVVGVPAGVKVYSSAFALSPHAAAEMVNAFDAGTDVTEAEVLDIDEDAFRENRLEARHYGYLLVPSIQSLRQPGKEGARMTLDSLEGKRDIAASFVERMDATTLYLLGPGTTVQPISEALGLPKTLLGIDAVYDGEVVAMDLNERRILALLAEYPKRKIVVTPLGGNGFLFGRGNKPFTPEVIRQVGRAHIVVVATEHKIQRVGALLVDTGDSEVDALLAGYIEVQVGYDVARVVKVRAA